MPKEGKKKAVQPQGKKQAKKANPGVQPGGGRELPKKAFEKAADEVARKGGARGTDIRSPLFAVKRIGEGAMEVPNQDPTINAKVLIPNRAIAYLAMGIVLRALKHGWLGVTQVANVKPYYAWRYLIDTFKSSIEGAIPNLQSAPRWMWEICASLQPKTEPFKTGAITYTGGWYDDGLGTDVAFLLGTGDEDYSIFWGTDSTGSIMEWPVLDAPPPYDFATNGAASVQALFEYFRNEGLNKRSGAPDPKALWMTHDTSAFAAVYPELGASYGCSSSLSNELFSERPINAPLFAKFAFYQSQGDPFYWRGYHLFRKSAGSPCYVGPRLSEMSIPRQMMNKCTPIFKFINFDEIFEVFSLHLAIAMERYAEAGEAATTCPLTPQEMQILLRQNLLQYFDNDMAQDLRLQDPGSWITFLPFTVGPNGIPSGATNTNMLFPLPLAENIRTLRRVTSNLANRLGDGNVLDIIPVLGRPPASVISQLGNYETNAGLPVYSTIPDPFVVDLVDCSVIDGTTKYLSFVGPALAQLATSFNDWYGKLSGATCSQVMVAAEPGPAVLCSLIYSNHYRYTPPAQPVANTTPALTKKHSEKSVTTTSTGSMEKTPSSNGLRAGHKNKGLGPSRLRKGLGAQPSGPTSQFFQTTAHTLVTGQLGFTSPVYKYISNFICPCALTVTSALESSYPALQTNWIEPFSLPMTSVSAAFALDSEQKSYPTMYEKHYNFAVQNCKAWNAPNKSEFELELEELGRHGRGGFLGDLAANVADAFGWKAGAKIAKTLGDVTGL